MRLILFFIAVVQTIPLFVNGAPSLPFIGGQTFKPQAGPEMTPSAAANGATNSDILIYYEGQDQPKHFKYGDCIAFKKDGIPVSKADFPTLVTCYGYKDAKCQSLFPPVPAPFLSPVQYANFLELGSTIWGSYNCYNADNDPLLKKLLHNNAGDPKPII